MTPNSDQNESWHVQEKTRARPLQCFTGNMGSDDPSDTICVEEQYLSIEAPRKGYQSFIVTALHARLQRKTV